MRLHLRRSLRRFGGIDSAAGALPAVPDPVGLAMAFEMAAYGLVSGLVYSRVQHNIKGIYLSLIPAMVVGRIVWGIAQVVLMGLSGGGFTFQAFIAGALINAVPAIVLQLILIPLIIAALQKAKIRK